MNCQTCRTHLDPFLDDELSVKDNVAVLEHLNACSACQAIVNSESRMWTSVRARLVKDRCPEASASRFRRELRRAIWRSRVSRWLIPAGITAAAAAILFAISLDSRETNATPRNPGQTPTFVAATPQPGRDHKERTHDHSVHGPLVAFVGARYDELVKGLDPSVTLTRANLATQDLPDRKLVDLDGFTKQVQDQLGAGFELPQGLLDGGEFVGGEVLKWNDTWIPQALVDYGDREIAFYAIPTSLAEKQIPKLKTIQQDKAHEIRIDQCSTCDVVLVLRNKTVYLLVSRQNRDWDDDWMVRRARKIL